MLQNNLLENVQSLFILPLDIVSKKKYHARFTE